MAKNVNEWIAAGFDSIQWSYVSSSGYITGSANLAATDTGTSSSMARLDGANAGEFQRNTPNIVNIQGDNTSLGQFLFEATDRPTFQLTVAQADTTFLNALGDGDAVTEGGWELYAKNTVGASLNRLCLLFTRDTLSKESGTDGDPGYEHLLLPNCQISFLGSGYTTQGEAAYNYQVIVNDTDTYIDGRSIATIFTDLTKTDSVVWSSNNRVSASVLVGDGVTTQITTANNPVTLDTDVIRGTVETTGFAADTATAVDQTAPFGVTLTATAASGKYQIVIYEFSAWG